MCFGDPVALSTYRVSERLRRNAISVASAADFELELVSKMSNPDFLLSSAAVSPYCLDPLTDRILLTELPADFDLTSAPFTYEAQYLHAERVHAIGINDFLELCQRLKTPARVLLVHSTGRCGSTLFMRAVRSLGVTTCSEPDIFSQIAMAGRAKEVSTRDAFESLHSACLNYLGRHDSKAFAIKFRSVVYEHADYLASALPSAANIFLYRECFGVARSYARVSNRTLTGWELNGTEKDAWSAFVPLLRNLPEPVTGYDLLAALWAGPVLNYLDTYEDRMWRGALDYADVIDGRNALLGPLLSDLLGVPGALPEELFEIHAQSGSHLAPQRSQPNPALERELETAEFAERLAGSLQKIDPRLHPKISLPGRISAGPLPAESAMAHACRSQAGLTLKEN